MQYLFFFFFFFNGLFFISLSLSRCGLCISYLLLLETTETKTHRIGYLLPFFFSINNNKKREKKAQEYIYIYICIYIFISKG